ncbi:hypothetical protein VitviT2T_017047 [Vitis vinifera]|uniref:Integrase catalytic domain-containing protein n=1 Tax=Vitis vinifera TaxID=29760 RepID=A0ABY9CSW0_VITVI|nr:hypothetical protein VitviT2T_017047 [Vitis vinifera]
MDVLGDSNLVLKQVRGDWKTRDAKLKPYHAYLELLIEKFEELKYIHLLRAHNQFVDALATLASTVDVPTNVIVHPLLIETRIAPAYCHLIDETEGIDIIRKISPKSSNDHEFILVAIDYFTKWVEAASYAKLTSTRVARFIRSHIICRYGVPQELILDRGAHFRAEVETLLQKYGIQHHRSSAYRPQTNGAVEAANKNIKRILRKTVETSRDWSKKLPFALWAYRTSFRTSTGATPYFLVYGMEVVLPVKTEMGSLRVILE